VAKAELRSAIAHDERIAAETPPSNNLALVESSTYEINALANFFRAPQATGKSLFPS
jgi:hypothetical protein